MAFKVGSWHTAGWIGRSPTVRLKEEERLRWETEERRVLSRKGTGVDGNARFSTKAELRVSVIELSRLDLSRPKREHMRLLRQWRVLN